MDYIAVFYAPGSSIKSSDYYRGVFIGAGRELEVN